MAKLQAKSKQEKEALKQQMKNLHKDGKTYQEIGDTFGISRQRVFQIIGSSDVRYFHRIGLKSCIYKGIRKYMNDNMISMTEMTRRLYDGVYSPLNFRRTRDRLNGNMQITKQYIDKILALTGLTYEVAFELENAEVN